MNYCKGSGLQRFKHVDTEKGIGGDSRPFLMICRCIIASVFRFSIFSGYVSSVERVKGPSALNSDIRIASAKMLNIVYVAVRQIMPRISLLLTL